MAETGWRRVARATLGAALAIAMLATVLSAGARWSWYCDLFTHFRPQITLAFAFACVTAALLRARVQTLVAAAGLAANVLFMAPVVWPAADTVVLDGRPVRVVSFNVAFFNKDFADLGPLLESLQADVVALQEVPPRELPALLARMPNYPHHFSKANIGDYGVVLMSRWPLAEARSVDLGVPDRPAAEVSVVFPDARLSLTVVHLVWPIGGESARQRDTQLAALAPVLAQCHGPCVAVGDFNVTRWSPRFQDLLRDSGMRDCASGLFVPQTWPSWRLPLRIRIDQCLANSAVAVTHLAAGPTAGSDHLPTISDLRVARSR
jgi:endonuclease/exonuclease/phosphatase (EEP) superfamily protein YafD